MFGKPAESDRTAAAFFQKSHRMYYLDAEGHIAHLDLRDRDIDAACLRVLRQLPALTNLTVQGNPIGPAVLEPIAQIGTLQRLDLRSCRKLTDASFRHLGRLTNLQSLELYDTVISDAGLAHLVGLSRLEELDLNATRVSDKGMALLKAFPDLRRLSIGGKTAITDAGLAHLKHMTKLEMLELREGAFSDAGLHHLQGCSVLKLLYAAGTKIVGPGLRHLAGLTHLEGLFLDNTGVGDDGLSHLAGLARLRDLGLTATQVTDAGLAHLRDLSGLRNLNLEHTRVTDAGKKRLKSVLPRCLIFISEPREIDLSAFDSRYFRDHPPSCISGFTVSKRPLREDGAVSMSFGLACRCGNTAGAVLGYPLAQYRTDYQGPEVFVGPLGFSCAACRAVTEIIDTDVNGYDGAMGSSATIRGEGRRRRFACSHCGGVEMNVTVQFSYGGGELDLLADEPDIRVEDFFGSFSADGTCTGCGKQVHIADFETA
jgi:Leucine-rich repeat (LRR) protein